MVPSFYESKGVEDWQKEGGEALDERILRSELDRILKEHRASSLSSSVMADLNGIIKEREEKLRN